MLAIRLQRRGRSGHASFRVIVQDSRWSPKSGKFVALLGSYDPHTKTTTLAKEKADFYLKNGAQPSERVALLLKQEGVKLPDWVEPAPKRKATIRNPEKLRKNMPKEAKPASTAEAQTPPKEAETKVAPEEKVAEKSSTETEVKVEEPANEQPVAEAQPAEAPQEEAEAPKQESAEMAENNTEQV